MPDRIEKNWLPNMFYAAPNVANTTMTTKELRETLLATNGTIIAAGYLWNINSKKVGPGVYRVTLEKAR